MMGDPICQSCYLVILDGYFAAGDMNVDTGGEFLRCLQGSKGGAACLRPRRSCQPLPKPHNVQGCGSHQMLQVGFDDAITMPF
jgi:hypothetical protein